MQTHITSGNCLPDQAGSQHSGILQCFVATLSEVGRDGAGCIPKQRDSTTAPYWRGIPVKDANLQAIKQISKACSDND
jgi:hypothetical protein